MTITRTTKLLLSAALGAGSLLGVAALSATSAHAQGTTGSIQGVVTDSASGEALAGVTVVVTSGQASQTAITEENGSYKITGLRPGDYLVTFFFGDTTIERKGVNVGVDKTTPVFQKINTQAAVQETIVIEDKAPAIDPTSTTQGITIDQEYTKNIPVPGRTFEATLGAAAGSQSDGVGVAFSGSSSLENQYYVDGVNTTGLRYGTSGSPVINNFIEEIEVITGGYNAEYGRATGAVINVVTITGDNTLKGEVFASMRPGLLIADREFTPFEGASIDTIGNLDYSADGGFVLSGPVIKDKLWFAVGVAPTWSRTKITRTTKRRMDCQQQLPSGELSACDPRTMASGGYADGTADVDPDTGFTLFETLGRRNIYASGGGAYVLGKLNYAVRPEHQGQFSVNAVPSMSSGPETYGLPQSGDYEFSGLTSDVSAKWTSKFNDNKTEIEGVVGWHRDASKLTPKFAQSGSTPYEVLIFGNLGTWATLGYEDGQTLAGCTDNAQGDLYPLIENCPDEIGHGYTVGGIGSIVDDKDNRYAGKLSLTQRVKALGSHEIKAGIDIEDNRLQEPRAYTGGVFFENYQDRSQIYTNRFIQVGPVGTDDPKFDTTCPYTPTGAQQSVNQPCRFIPQNGEGATIQGQTVNWSTYLRDSWQVRPNLTVNAGIRYEEQRLRFAEYLRDDFDVATGQPFGKNAMTMTNMWAPRLGVLYDWTKEGRSKIYGHWGRFYESIPMNINSRSFAGEVSYRQVYDYDQCGMSVPGYGSPSGNGCPTSGGGANDIIGINGTLVTPGIKPQFMDERILGVEYELAEDLKIGIAYQNRELGRVIEDVSTDGAATYVIANPGEWSSEEEAKLQARIDAEDDPATRSQLETLMRQFRGVRLFDSPVRDYNAIQFTLTRRFSKALYMQGSYTYAKTKGNFPGLIAYDSGQVDPNISSQYDLIELTANRQGALPQDKPHYIKLDGYYQFDLKQAGTLTTGARIRALSGEPRQALARHWLYGPNESFLLPRGTVGRTQFETGLDLHVGYARKLKSNMELEIYGDIFNVFNDQGVAGVSDAFSTRSASNPIVGGTYEDLIFAKENSLSTGGETSTPIKRNPNYGNTTARYAPLTVQLGARLSF
jgi:outer membrane receptor protein involved in Fe transport